ADAVREQAAWFVERLEDAVARGRERLAELAADGPLLFWQASAKAVGMLQLLGGAAAVAAVVDVNPWKHGLHLPGRAHPIVSPEQIAGFEPAHIVCMNSAYVDEIAAELRLRRLDVPLITASDLIAA